MDFTISRRLSSGRLHAYYKKRFWFWDDTRNVWTESHLMSQKYEREHSARAALTPEDFMSDLTRFSPLDEYELDSVMVDALKNAIPCKTVPIEPVKEESECATAQNVAAAVTTAENAAPTATVATPTTSENVADASSSTPVTSLQSCESAPTASAGGSSVSTIGAPPDKPLTFIPENKTPEFDYSGLDKQTVEDLHFAEDEYRHGKQMAERGLVHMGNAIAAAHDALCGVVALCDNSKHGNRGEDTFRAWCVSIGITKDTAYRLLQVSALMEGSSPRQKAILEALPPTLLYAVAKPSAPEELVEKVKNGEVSTNKEYQALLAQIKAEKERADAAEGQLEAVTADVQGLSEENARLTAEKEKAERGYNEMYESRITANLQRQKAEAERDRAVQRARNAEDALKNQPITAVVDKEEVTRQAKKLFADLSDEEIDRRAHQQAYGIAAGMTQEITAERDKLRQDNDVLKSQLAEAQAVVPADLIADKETADNCYLNIDGVWGMALPSFRRLIGTGEDFNNAAGKLIQLCDHIHEELVKMTITNDKETLYE